MRKRVLFSVLLCASVLGCLVSCNPPLGEPVYTITMDIVGRQAGEAVTTDFQESPSGEEVTVSVYMEKGRAVNLSSPDVTFSQSTLNGRYEKAVFTMPAANIHMTATFVDQPRYSVTINASDAGENEYLRAEPALALPGSTIRLYAALDAQRMVKLSAPGVELSSSIVRETGWHSYFVLPESDVVVNAEFKDLQPVYNVNVVSSGAQYGESLQPSVTFSEAGQTITLTAALGSLRRVNLSSSEAVVTPASIDVDGGTATFTMPDKEVTVNADFESFSPVPHDVAVDQQNGAQSGEYIELNTSSATEGSTVMVTAHLNADRHVELQADPVLAIAPQTIAYDGGTATFTMPNENVKISGTFSDNQYSVSLSLVNEESGESAHVDKTLAAAGETVTITLDSINAHRRVSLSSSPYALAFSESVLHESGDEASFTMPVGDVDITAGFEDVPEITFVVEELSYNGSGNYGPVEHAIVTVDGIDLPAATDSSGETVAWLQPGTHIISARPDPDWDYQNPSVASQITVSSDASVTINMKTKYFEGGLGPTGGYIVLDTKAHGLSLMGPYWNGSQLVGHDCRFIEMAPQELNDRKKWSTNSIITWNSDNYGDGDQMTYLIVNQIVGEGRDPMESAAGQCWQFSYGGRSDWFLPTYTTMSTIRLFWAQDKLNGAGLKENEEYWTSTQMYSSSQVFTRSYTIKIVKGSNYAFDHSRGELYYYRPVRKF